MNDGKEKKQRCVQVETDPCLAGVYRARESRRRLDRMVLSGPQAFLALVRLLGHDDASEALSASRGMSASLSMR